MAPEQTHLPRHTGREHDQERHRHRAEEKTSISRFPIRSLSEPKAARSKHETAPAPSARKGRNGAQLAQSARAQLQPARSQPSQAEKFIENEGDARPAGAPDSGGAGADLHRPEIIETEAGHREGKNKERANETGKPRASRRRAARTSREPPPSLPAPTGPRSSSLGKGRRDRRKKAETRAATASASSGCAQQPKKAGRDDRGKAEEDDVGPRLAQVIPEKRIRQGEQHNRGLADAVRRHPPGQRPELRRRKTGCSRRAAKSPTRQKSSPNPRDKKAGRSVAGLSFPPRAGYATSRLTRAPSP